ncbi:golgi SNAP receptor complex member Gos28 isoform X2 [Oratosquilla oratoria]|uniref:golgi SNAP receptor complex member Gos28 isoform X2 n=1 Tax=Oratosquilla oratoria TaxID=337810 RepID=UPI003F75B443
MSIYHTTVYIELLTWPVRNLQMSTTNGEDEAESGTMSFEDLRKRARQLESEIDVKLVSLSKVATSYGSSNSNNSETQSLLSSSQVYDTVSTELEQLLAALTDVNERMGNSVHGTSVATIHTIQRHRDILQDYHNEFQRTTSTIRTRRERELLLGTGRNDGKSLSGLSRRDLYLKEGEHLGNSENMIDDQLSIAIETRDHMKNQRETFKMIQTKLDIICFPIFIFLEENLQSKRIGHSHWLSTQVIQ